MIQTINSGIRYLISDICPPVPTESKPVGTVGREFKGPPFWLALWWRGLRGEGGIRTHDPAKAGYRFSRPAPSTTRTPLLQCQSFSRFDERVPISTDSVFPQKVKKRDLPLDDWNSCSVAAEKIYQKGSQESTCLKLLTSYTESCKM